MVIYVLSHKKPDTDSIASSIAYSLILNSKGIKSVPARTDELNPETKFVLEKFGIPVPDKITNSPEKKFILVDHNEFSQSIEGLTEEQVNGVIDHHMFKAVFTSPKFIRTEPLGATSSIIFKMFDENKIEIPKEIAGILLSAILSDTVVFASPTSTEEDKKIAEKIAQKLDIKDINSFGIEIKKKKADMSGLSPSEIISMDYKVFEKSGKKYGVAQVELVETEEISSRKSEIISEMEKMLSSSKMDLLCLMVTNIIKKNTNLWFVGDEKIISSAFQKQAKENSINLPGVMSRKKEIVPPIEKALS